MSEYMFGVSYEKPSRKNADIIWRIAKKHGAVFVEVNVRNGAEPGINGGRYQAWFAGPNRGDPFNQNMADAIDADLRAVGL